MQYPVWPKEAPTVDLAGEQLEVVIVLAFGWLSFDLAIGRVLLVVILADWCVGLLGLRLLAALRWSGFLCIVLIGYADVSCHVK